MFSLEIIDYITSSDLKQYIYCPIIPWIMGNYLVEEPPTPSMDMGKLGIDEKELIANELDLPKPIKYEVHIISKKLRATGIVDIIAGNRRLTVVEVKKFQRPFIKHYEIQLKFYAYLANTEIAPVHKAILIVGSKMFNYSVGLEEIKTIEELIKKVREIKNSPRPPTINAEPNKCLKCWYRRYCIRF
ncbi:MAG: CRISPR-associated protein Cas4 [Sulfolobales archaeon]